MRRFALAKLVIVFMDGGIRQAEAAFFGSRCRADKALACRFRSSIRSLVVGDASSSARGLQDDDDSFPSRLVLKRISSFNAICCSPPLSGNGSFARGCQEISTSVVLRPGEGDEMAFGLVDGRANVRFKKDNGKIYVRA